MNLQGRYSRPVGPGELGAMLNYSWTSKVPTTLLNNDPGLLKAVQHDWRTSVGLLNATLDYRLPEQGLTFSAFATNLTDKHYQRYALTFAAPAETAYGYTGITLAPRMYGFSIRKSFGAGE
jgi:outer membrane receptor protein involved in Fe transport